jgi:pimeloyl-ACP methyl ester carboxylesterase
MKNNSIPPENFSSIGATEYFDFNDCRIFYLHAGTGRPMLFLHNGGASHKIWERQSAHFADQFECFTFDLPGYGASANPKKRYPLKLYVEFLSAFITARNLQRVVLVGNCIGSATSLLYTIQSPRVVERLILFNLLTDATVRDGNLGLIFKATEPVPFLRPILRSISESLPIPDFLAKRFVSMQFKEGGKHDPKLAAELTALYHHKGQVKALSDILVDIPSFKPLDQYTIPPDFPKTLLIWGSDNKILRCRAGRIVADRLKPDRFEILEGAGHIAMHEFSSDANRIMDDFLR